MYPNFLTRFRYNRARSEFAIAGDPVRRDTARRIRPLSSRRAIT